MPESLIPQGLIPQETVPTPGVTEMNGMFVRDDFVESVTENVYDMDGILVRENFADDVKKPELTIGRVGGAFWQGLKSSPSQFIAAIRGQVNQNRLTPETVTPMDTEVYKNILDIDDIPDTVLTREASQIQKRARAYVDKGMEKELAINMAVVDNQNARIDEIDKFLKVSEDWEGYKISPEYQQSSGLVEDASKTIGQTAPAMVAMGINAPTGIFMMWEQMYGAKFKELTDNLPELDSQRAARAAAMSATLQLPLETVGNILKLKALLGTKAFRQAVVKLVGAVAGEGVTEFLQQYPDEFATYWAMNPDLSMKEVFGLFWADREKITENAIYAGEVGGVAGLLTSGPGTVVSTGRSIKDFISSDQKKLNEERKVAGRLLRKELNKDNPNMTTVEELASKVVGTKLPKIDVTEENVNTLLRDIERLVRPTPIRHANREKMLITIEENPSISEEEVNAMVGIWDSLAYTLHDNGYIDKPEDFYDIFSLIGQRAEGVVEIDGVTVPIPSEDFIESTESMFDGFTETTTEDVIRHTGVELAHVMYQVDINAMKDLTAQLKMRDVDPIEWTNEERNRFGEAFTKYIKEGLIETTRTGQVLNELSKMLSSVYSGIRNQTDLGFNDIDIAPEVSDTLDTLLQVRHWLTMSQPMFESRSWMLAKKSQHLETENINTLHDVKAEAMARVFDKRSKKYQEEWEKIEDQVKKRTKTPEQAELWRSKHADLLAARDAEIYMDMLSAEIDILTEKLGVDPAPYRARVRNAKKIAKKNMEFTTVEEIKSDLSLINRNLRDEIEAANNAFQAGGLAQLLREKQGWVKKVAEIQSKSDANLEVTKIERIISRLINNMNRLNIPKEYKVQLTRLLKSYYFVPESTLKQYKKGPTLEEFTEELTKLGEDTRVLMGKNELIPKATNKEDMQFREFKAMRDTLKSLNALGTNSNSLVTSIDFRNRIQRNILDQLNDAEQRQFAELMKKKTGSAKAKKILKHYQNKYPQLKGIKIKWVDQKDEPDAYGVAQLAWVLNERGGVEKLDPSKSVLVLIRTLGASEASTVRHEIEHFLEVINEFPKWAQDQLERRKQGLETNVFFNWEHDNFMEDYYSSRTGGQKPHIVARQQSPNRVGRIWKMFESIHPGANLYNDKGYADGELGVTETAEILGEWIRHQNAVGDNPVSRANADNISEEIDPTSNLKGAVSEFWARLKKARFILKRADGYVEQGPVHESIFRPIANAENAQDTYGREKIDEFKGAIDALLNSVGEYENRKRFNYFDESVDIVGSKPITKGEAIMVGLNVTNEGNSSALRKNFENESIKDPKKRRDSADIVINNILNTLSQADIKFINEVLKIVDMSDSISTTDKTVDGTSKVYRQLTGLTLDKVEGTPRKTANGTINGGYFPKIFQRQLDQDVAAHSELFTNGTGQTWAKPPGQFVFDRTVGDMPLRLDMTSIAEHIHNVVRYVTHSVPLRDVSRIVTAEGFKNAIIDTQGKDTYNQLVRWLSWVGNPIPKDSFIGKQADNAIRTLKTGVVANLIISIPVMLKQFLSFTNTMHELGFKQSFAAFGDTTEITEEVTNEGLLPITRSMKVAMSKSPFIRNRRRKYDQDILDATERFRLPFRKNDPTSAQMRRFMSDRSWRDTIFEFIRFADGITVGTTWLSAYNKAMSDNMNEEQAINFADDTVARTQPTFTAKDSADIQRGSVLMRSFVMFYSFFNVMRNSLGETNHKVLQSLRGKEYKAAVREVLRGYLYKVFLPSYLALAINYAAAAAGGDDEWDKNMARDAVFAPFLFVAAGVPFLRDMVTSLLQGWDYRPVPILSVPFEQVKKMWMHGWRGIDQFAPWVEEPKEVEWKQFMKDATETVGIGSPFIYPGGVPTRLITRKPFNIFERIFAEERVGRIRNNEIIRSP
jgi:chorismate mutase